MFIKLMVLALIVAIAGLFFVKGPDGQPLLTVSELKPELSMPDESRPLQAADNPGGDNVQVYRWQDAEGNWHYSDTDRSSEGADSLYFNPNANVEPGIPTSALPGGSMPSLADGKKEMTQSVQALMEKAQDVKQQLEQRDQILKESQ